MLKALLIVGLAVLPAACSDDGDSEEAVDMPAGGDSLSDNMDQPLPANPSASKDMKAPSLTDLAQGAQQNSAAQAQAQAQAAAGLANNGLPKQIEGEGAKTGALNGNASGINNGKPLYVRCAVLRVRSGAGVNFPTVGYVTYNMQVTPLEIQNGKWVKIGPNKFVSRPFLSDDLNSKQFIPAH